MSKPVRRAVVKDPSGVEEQTYLLLQIEPKLFRWNPLPPEAPDHLSIEDGIRWLRAWQEAKDPLLDLTIYPIEDFPDVRAAKLIAREITRDWDNDVDGFIGRIGQIIREETHCEQLLKALNELTTYFLINLGNRDRVAVPFLLQAVLAIEAATGEDLANIKAKLTEPAPRIVRPGSVN